MRFWVQAEPHNIRGLEANINEKVQLSMKARLGKVWMQVVRRSQTYKLEW